MRPANCRKLCWNTPWPRSLLTIAGSNVTPASAESATLRETPCATASFLKSSNQRSKLTLVRHGAASAGCGAASAGCATTLASRSAPTHRSAIIRRIATIPQEMTGPLRSDFYMMRRSGKALGGADGRAARSRCPNGDQMDRLKPEDLRLLGELEKKVLWLASWTIHHANHVRESDDGLKVGGHQASSASLATIMTALYFHALRPQDRVAVKPHASPNFHAIQYLLGRQTREKLVAFRGYKGAQSYPSRTKDTDDVDFSTGSVGLGVAQTLFSSLTQDYVRAHGWGLDRPEGRTIALVGDAELDEGNVFEAMLEGWKHGLRNCWWIIDYNRQSLDAVIREGLWARYEALFRAFGLGRRDPQVRLAAETGFPRARRRSPARLDRQVSEPALFGAGVPGRRRLAQAPQ